MSSCGPISSEQITILSTLIGVLLSEDLNVDEQNILGNILINIGQALVTIASLEAIQQFQQNGKQQNQLICKQLDQLNSQINLLKQQIKN